MANIEKSEYKAQFNPNNVVEDKAYIEEILKTFKKWNEVTWNDGKQYCSFSKQSWNSVETVFVEKQRLTHLEATYTAIAKAYAEIEEFKLEAETKSELKAFETKTRTFNNLPEAQSYIRAMDELTLKTIVENYINDYKDLRKRLPRSEGNKHCRDELYDILTQNIKSLKDIKSELKRHKYKNGLDSLKARIWQLVYYFPHYEQVRQILALWWSTSDIPRIIDSIPDAKRARRYEQRDAEHQQEMNEILSETAALSQQNRRWEWTEEALEAITNWEMAPVQVQNTDIYTQSTTCRQNNSCRRSVCNQKSFNRRFGERFSNMLEQIFPNGMNKDPRQKEAWTNIWSVLAVWWAIFMWIKAITSLKKGADWKRNRWAALWWTAWTLALLNFDTVARTIQDAFNRHPAEKSRAVNDLFSRYWFSDSEATDIAHMYVWAPIATMSALHFIPIYELEKQKILEDDMGKIAFNYNNYEKYINTLGYTDEQKQTLLAYWKRVKDDNLIGLGLWTFGIWTMEDLHDAYNWNTTTKLWDTVKVQQWRENCIERISSWVNAELYKHWLRAKNPTTLEQIVREYDAAKKDNTKTKDLILRWMKAWLLEISDNDGLYNLAEMIDKDGIELDLDKMTMKWFTNSWWTEIIFDSYWDLFYTVHLTNWVKQNFNRPAVSMNPFHINIVTWRIEFDDTKRYELHKTDTNIVKNSTLKENSSLLSKNKEFYVNYLNEWRRWVRKIDTDPTKYPMVSKLWIDFYSDENEIQELETWLNNIKIRLTSAWRVPKKPNPFSFGILGTWIIDKLMFKPASWSSETIDTDLSSKFPTIRKNGDNKDKLLKFLNDPTNWMCNRY